MVEIKDNKRMEDDEAEKYVNGWRCSGIRNFLSTIAAASSLRRLVHGVTHENNTATTTLQFIIIYIYIPIS